MGAMRWRCRDGVMASLGWQEDNAKDLKNLKMDFSGFEKSDDGCRKADQSPDQKEAQWHGAKREKPVSCRGLIAYM